MSSPTSWALHEAAPRARSCSQARATTALARVLRRARRPADRDRALFVQGDVGYLSYGATLPEHRGQGLQRLLLAKRIRVALALGCRAIVSETGEAVTGQRSSSYNNMVCLGLCPIATRDNYVLDGVGWR